MPDHIPKVYCEVDMDQPILYVSCSCKWDSPVEHIVEATFEECHALWNAHMASCDVV